MNTVFGCLDGTASTAAAIDWAAWFAQRPGVRLELLHVLKGHLEQAEVTDFSGAIGPAAQSSLPQELNTLDARRSQLAQEACRRWLGPVHARCSG